MPMGYTPGGYTPGYTAAYSPFSYQGAAQVGQQAGQTAAVALQTVTAPVVGFATGILQTRTGLILALGIGAFFLLNANQK